MVILKQNKHQYLLQGMSLVADVRELYAYLQVSTLEPIKVYSVLEVQANSKTDTVVCMDSVFEGDHYKSRLVYEKQYNLISKAYKEYSGKSDAKKYLSALGVECLSETMEVEWFEPIHSYTTLLKALNEKTKVNNGGAPRWVSTTEGKFVMVDVVKSMEQQSKELTGVVVEDSVDISWSTRIPGNLKVFYSSLDVSEVRSIECDKRFPWGVTICNDNTGFEYEALERKFKSEFLFRKFTTRKLVVNQIVKPGYNIGDKVNVNKKVEGVIIRIEMPIRLAGESTSFSVVVACQGLSEQK